MRHFLGFFLCFDTVQPACAAVALQQAGMPKAIVAMLTQQWENQERYMQLAGITHPQVQEVHTSLPQGDPWSPLALTCLLAGPLRELEERVPNVTTTVFVDDRTWTARRLEDLLAAARLWRAWSAALGLKENALKEQWSHRDPAGRRNLQRHVSPEPWRTSWRCWA